MDALEQLDKAMNHRWDNYVRQQDLMLARVNDWFGRDESDQLAIPVEFAHLFEGLPHPRSLGQSTELFKRTQSIPDDPWKEHREKTELDEALAKVRTNPHTSDYANSSVYRFTKAMHGSLLNEPTPVMSEADARFDHRFDRVFGVAAAESDTWTLLMAKFRAALAKAGDELLAGRTVVVDRTSDLKKAAQLSVETAEHSRRRSIADWIAGQLLKGETIESLAKYAEDGSDPERAAEIREIGRKFAAAA